MLINFLRRIFPIHQLQTTNYKLLTSGGFTLIEILVAVFIFGVALTATSYLIIVNIQNANAVRNNIIASGLLQEGVEVTRNIRDRGWHLDPANPTLNSLPDGTYRVQWNSIQCDGAGAPSGCATPPFLTLGSNPVLKRDTGTGLYSYNTGTDTIFRRTVQIATISPVEKRVTVTVSWSRGSTTQSVSAEAHLYNWF